MMNTDIVKTVEGKTYNRWNEEVIKCSKNCGRLTTMLGTKLCDQCWEAERKERMKEKN